MTFLNITFLFALALGALPLLIHLLNRQRYQRIRFPTLRFLQELQKQRMRRLKLRQIILLILRTLAILCAVLALSRPVLRGSNLPGLPAKSSTASVVLLDVSGSSAAVTPEGTVFHQIITSALRLANMMNEGDKSFPVALSVPPKLVIPDGTENRAYLEENLKGLSPLPLSSDLSASLDVARPPLESSPQANHELYIISDFDKNCWNGKTSLTDKIPPNTKIFLVPVGPNRIPNHAVVKTQILSRLLEPNRPIEVDVTVTNFSDDRADNLFLSLYFENRRVAQSSISLAPSETKSLQFSILPDGAGFMSGYAVLEDDDALLLDNRNFFTLNIPERIRVVLVGSDPSVMQFLKIALSPQGDNRGTVEVRDIPISKWETADLKDTDVLILADIPNLSSGATQKVRNFVARGGGVLLLPGPRIDIANYNSGVLKELGLPSLGAKVGSESPTSTALLWDKVDWTHPLFSGMFRDDTKPEPPRVYQTYQTFGGQNTVAVVTLSNSSPTLSEVVLDRGRAFLCTTYPDPMWSDLWRHGLFAPLMHRISSYLTTARAGEQEVIHAGSPLVFVTDQTSALRDVLLTKPSGETVQIIPKTLPQLVELTYPVAEQLGVYKITERNNTLQTFAVNLDPTESDLSRCDLDLLRKSLGADRTQIIDSEHLESQILAARYGQELWHLFLLGSLGFLIAEMLIAREGRRSGSELP
jgi:hypothetical protein